MPIVKTIEPEREQIPFYDSLSDEEIEAILESDSFSFNPKTGILDIAIPEDTFIFDPTLGENVFSIGIDGPDVEAYLEMRGLSEEEIEYFLTSPMQVNKKTSIEEIRDDYHWQVGVSKKASEDNPNYEDLKFWIVGLTEEGFIGVGNVIAELIKRRPSIKQEFGGDAKLREFVNGIVGGLPYNLNWGKKALDDHGKKILHDYLSSTGYDQALMRVAGKIVAVDSFSRDYWKKVLREMGITDAALTKVMGAVEKILPVEGAFSPGNYRRMYQALAEQFKDEGGMLLVRAARQEIFAEQKLFAKEAK